MIEIAKKLGATFRGYGYPFDGTERLTIASSGFLPYATPTIVNFTPARTDILQTIAFNHRSVGGWADGWVLNIAADGELIINITKVYGNLITARTGIFCTAGTTYEVALYMWNGWGTSTSVQFYEVYVNGSYKVRIPGSYYGFDAHSGAFGIGGHHSVNTTFFYGTIWSVTLFNFLASNSHYN